jgi:hypothetical protein
MKCPNCNKGLSILKAKDEFACPKCHAKIRSENYLRDFFISTAPFLLISIIIGAFIDNIIVLAIAELFNFMIMMAAFSSKIKLHVVKEQINKPKEEISI